MALQILPQMQFSQPRSWSGGSRGRSRAADDGISKAIKLENLYELEDKREVREQEKEARTSATAQATEVVDQEGMTVNYADGTTGEQTIQVKQTDPRKAMELYGFELAKTNPELGLKYNTALTAHKQAEQNITAKGLEMDEKRLKIEDDQLKLDISKKEQPLKLEMIRTDATMRGFDYFAASKDVEGAKRFLNMYEPKETDQIADLTLLQNGDIMAKQNDGDVFTWDRRAREFVQATHDQQLRSMVDLLELDESKRKHKEEKAKEKAKVVPRDATLREREDAAAWLELDPSGASLSNENRKVLARDLAQEIVDLQTSQKNQGLDPDSQDRARAKVMNKLSKRMLPATQRVGAFGIDWLSKDTPATYFTSSAAVKVARENGQITEDQKNALLKGFDDSPKEEATKETSSDKVKVKNPKGEVGTIPRSQLDAAKKEGFTEVK